ncbi:hypothetical protein [Polynucleobacter sp. Fuers-14]|uniref:hypothetical protein n=1 Tax=Polynucleobacter sp. Fuers-14 TaxID=1758364 RepID=UPI001C0B5EB1|nr:hypothetical protein [Polynucleobacter sp. Fuers-14]MBU3641075.1 hypothetical protein [Polynucleobacter sp. Fuers-14]
MNAINFFSRLIFFFLLYIFLFALIRLFDNSAIVFYQGNNLIIVMIISLILFDWFRNKNLKFIIDNTPFYFCAGVLCFSFLTTFPVILDRSITLHMYNFLAHSTQGVTVDQIRNDFIAEFVFHHSAIEKRVIEQEVLGNISKSDNNIYLTESGYNSYRFFQFLNKLFNISPTY